MHLLILLGASLHLLALIPGPASFPSDGGLGGQSGYPHPDSELRFLCFRAKEFSMGLEVLWIAANFLGNQVSYHTLVFFLGRLDMCGYSRLVTVYSNFRKPSEFGTVIHREHICMQVVQLAPRYIPDDCLEPGQFRIKGRFQDRSMLNVVPL